MAKILPCWINFDWYSARSMTKLNFFSAPEITKIHVVLSREKIPLKAYLSLESAKEDALDKKVHSVPLEDFDVTSPDLWKSILGELPEIQQAIEEGVSVFESLKKGKWESIDLSKIPERCSVFVVSDRQDYPLKAFITESEALDIVGRNPDFTVSKIPLEDFDFWSLDFYQNLIGEIQGFQKTINQGIDFLESINPFLGR